MVKDIISRHPKEYEGKNFSINHLLTEEKVRDFKDLTELLMATYVELPERHVVMKDLVKLCK